MPRLTKAEEQLNLQIECFFNQHGSGAKFNVMDLGKISEAGKRAHAIGGNVENAVITAIAQYRTN